MDENDISQIQRNTDVMSNRHSSVFGDGGVRWEHVKYFVCASVSVTFRAEIDTYSENQKQIFNKIKRLKKKGLGYRRIAQYLNSKNIKTDCGNEFKNNNVHSMLKKGLIRHNRLKQKPKIEIYDVSINYPI